ncbi:hypothetical protein TeGR_g14957 [Tetraparma gracilis]|nr:hypothetical protein TeGR_g14957 [Tetraparma gracilis]
MYSAMLSAPVGDDVFGEDPTVAKLESHLASLFGKEAGLFFPTGTQSNLCGLMAHCNSRSSEIILGSNSHLCLYEQGGLSTLGSIHSRQLPEDPETAQVPIDAFVAGVRGDDPHYPRTAVAAIENTHNVLGGKVLPASYISSLGAALAAQDVPLHIDGARIFNACVKLNVTPAELCAGAASVSICLSKGLGSPVGSVLVGSKHVVGLARRARKAAGGGMRQAGVIAAAGLYAVENNVERLADDHQRAEFLCGKLREAGYGIEVAPTTNLCYFTLPDGCALDSGAFADRCKERGVLVGLMYGETFRFATHKDVDDEGLELAAKVFADVLR